MQDKDSIANKDQELSLSDDSSKLNSGGNSLPSLERPISKREFEARLTRVTGSFTSPLPPPEILKAYDIVEHGLAGKIFNLAEKQANHRMELEKAVIFGDGKRSWTGLILGFIVVCLFLGGGTYLVYEGHDLAGGILAGVNIPALIGVFIYGTNTRSQERIQKQKALLGDSSDSK